MIIIVQSVSVSNEALRLVPPVISGIQRSTIQAKSVGP